MGLIIANKSQIEGYFASDALGQSTLKGLLGGFDSFMNKTEENEKERQGLIIGSSVDTILTGNEGDFDEEYHVSLIDKKPSDVEMSIFKTILQSYLDAELVPETRLEYISEEVILNAANFAEWQMRWKDETRVTKLREVGSEYYADLCASVGKQILSMEENNRIQDIVMSLRTHFRTKDYFNRQAIMHSKDVDVYYQLPIYFFIKGVPCKALLDMLIVVKDEQGRIIKLIPVDLKTMAGNTLYFMSKVNSFRYDIQAAWYTTALQHWLEQFGLKDIEIENFRFVVESSTSPGSPLVYKLDDNLMKRGRFGLPEVVVSDDNREVKVSREIRGYESLLDEYLYYQSIEWEKDKVLVDNPREIMLGLDGII